MFTAAGIPASWSNYASIALFTESAIFILPTIYFTEKLGRRPLLLISMFGIALLFSVATAISAGCNVKMNAESELISSSNMSLTNATLLLGKNEETQIFLRIYSIK